jgi:hypothetical protein
MSHSWLPIHVAISVPLQMRSFALIIRGPRYRSFPNRALQPVLPLLHLFFLVQSIICHFNSSRITRFKPSYIWACLFLLCALSSFSIHLPLQTVRTHYPFNLTACQSQQTKALQPVLVGFFTAMGLRKPQARIMFTSYCIWRLGDGVCFCMRMKGC